MIKIGVGLVFLADPDKSDEIIEELRQRPDVELLYCVTSYDKLWIMKGSEVQPQHDKN